MSLSADVPTTGSAWRDAQEEVLLPAGEVAHPAVSIRFLDRGQARRGTVLLLHGIPTWGFLWGPVVAPLVQAGFRVVVPDLLGHGFSDRRDLFDRGFTDQARMVRALTRALGIERAHLVGHDTGGAASLVLAVERAAFLDRLVLMNTVCYDRFDDDMLDFGHPLRWKPRPLADLRAALEESVGMGLSRADRNTDVFREGILLPWMSEEGKLSLLRNASALNANQTMALVPRHAEVTAPTLVLWGLDDPWQKAEDGQRLASEIPGARFEGIGSANHWAQQDAPAEVAAALLAHLAG